MKQILTLAFIFSLSLPSVANNITERVDAISSIIHSEPDSALVLAAELMSESKDLSDEYGLVQSNFIIAYVYDDVKGDFGKAIIYYLEAIRYAETASYKDVNKNLTSLNKNCGVIFRKFNSYGLAKSYYEKALDYAALDNDVYQSISIRYNLSGLYKEQGLYPEAIQLLHDILSESEFESKKYFEILNRLSATYFESGDFDQSIYYSELLLKSCQSAKLNTYANNLLGRAYMKKGRWETSNEYLLTALDIIEENPESFYDNKAKLDVLSDLGENEIKNHNPSLALSYFKLAEDIIPEVTQNPEYFKIYKSIANLHFEEAEYQVAKNYEDLYATSLGNYLKMQEEIQQTDKRYNMDLITKRYFDEVAKQEKIASILFYSKLASGSLLFLLLFSVGYSWYQKVRIRKSIQAELVKLKILS